MVIRFIVFFLLIISQSTFAYTWQNVDEGIFYICDDAVSKLQMDDHSDVKSVEFQQNGNKLPSSSYSISAIYAGMTIDAIITLKDGSVVTESIQIKDEPKWTLRVDEGKSQLCNGVPATLKAVVRQGTRKIPADFSWVKDGEEVSTEENFSTLISGQYSLNATAFGCTKTVVASVVPSPTPSISGNDGLCLGESLTLIASDMDSYEWQGGETSNSATFIASGDYYVVGAKTIGKTVCRDTLHFTIHPKMSANIKFGGVTAFCPGADHTEISADHYLTESQIESYEWSRGGVTFSSDKKITVTEEGRYRAIVKTTDGCKSFSEVVISYVDTVADVIIPNLVDEICSGHQTAFSAEGQDLTRFEWFGSGLSFGSGDSQYSLAKGGDYSVVGYTTNGCKSKEFKFHIDEIQSPTIFLNSIIPCEGDVDTISCTVTSGSEFFWISPDSINGVTSKSIAISHSGRYRAQVKDLVTGCVTEAYTDVEFLPYPEISIIGDLAFCKNAENELQVDVDNRMNTKYSYSWIDSKGKVIDSDSLVLLKKSGDYQVAVSNSHNCETRKDFSVEVTPSPKLKGDTLKHLCENSLVTLTMNGADHYQWSKQGKKLGTDSNKYKASSSGTFQVVGTNENGCSDTAKVKVELAVKPIIKDIIKPACGSDFGMIALQADKKCMFKWPDGSADSTFSFSTAEEFTVVITDSVSGCRSNHKVESVVRDIPFGSIVTDNLEACVGDSLTLEASFTAQDGDIKYEWNCTIDTSSTIILKQSGKVVVTATDSLGCVGTAETEVLFHELPKFEIQSADVVCKDSTATLTAQSETELSYEWFVGDGQLGQPQGIAPTNVGKSIVVDKEGDYICTATDIHGCVASKMKHIVLNSPKIQISGNPEVCVDSLSYLSVNGDCQQFYWDNNAVDTPFFYAPAGLAKVVGIDSFGCKAYAEIMITERKRPTLIAPDSVSFCERESVDVDFYSNDAVRFEWDGESVTEYGVSTNIEGDHFVVGYDSVGCPTDTKKVYAEMIPLPELSIGGKSYLCGMDDSTTLTVDNKFCTRLHWNTGDVSSSVGIYRPGKYTVVGYNGGCVSDTASFEVKRVALPKIDFVDGKTKSFCKGDSVTFEVKPSDVEKIKWKNNRLNNNIFARKKVVNAEGFYVVEATDSLGCTSIDSVYAKELPSPFLSISGDSVVCENRNIELVANGAECQNIVWSDGSAGKTITVDKGVNVWAIGFDNNGCQSDTVYHSVKRRMNPKVTITGATQIASSQTATLTANVVDSDSHDYRYSWLPGHETTSQISVDGSHINMYENYSVTVTDEYGCFDHAVVRVTGSELSVDGKFEFCEGDSAEISLFAPASNSVVWSNGSVGGSAFYSKSGNHYVVATAPNGVSDTVWFKITVHQNPKLMISGSTQMCEGDSVKLTAVCTDDIMSVGAGFKPARYLQWSNGKSEEEITVFAGGEYTVVARSEFGCESRDTIKVSEHKLPKIEFMDGKTKPFCKGDSVEFEVKHSDELKIKWENNRLNNNIFARKKVVNAEGFYVVEATDSLGCTSIDSVYAKELPSPFLSISGDSVVCENRNIELVANGAECQNIVWNDGSVGKTITVDKGVNVWAVGFDNNGCQSDTVYHSVKRRMNPKVTITGAAQIATSQTATLTANVDDADRHDFRYSWLPGHETTSQISVDGSLINMYENYSVTVTDEYGCFDHAVVRVIGSELSVDGKFEFCEGDSAEISLFAPASNSVVWSNGSVGRSAFYSKSGNHYVVATAPNGVSDTVWFKITVHQNPKLMISGATQMCEGDSVKLTAVCTDDIMPVGAGFKHARYLQWSNGKSEEEITVFAGGEYTVVARSEFGCERRDSIKVDEHSLPKIKIEGADTLRRGESAILTAFGGKSYWWGTGESTVPSIEINVGGRYKVTGTDSAGCKNVAYKDVVEIDVPVPFINGDIGGEFAICEGDSMLLIASGGDYYIWDDGRRNPQRYAKESRLYTVSVCLNNGECSKTSFGVKVLPRPQIDVAGKTQICDGEVTELAVLQKSGSPLVDYEWSSGAKNPVVYVRDAERLSVVAKDLNGCVSNSVETTIEKYAAEDVFIDGDFDICEKSDDVAKVRLMNSNVVKSSWIDESNGDTLSTFAECEFAKGGKYSVSVVNKNGCGGQKQFMIHQRSLPTVEIAGAEYPVCNKQYAKLTAISDSRCTYEWSTGEEGNEVKVMESGDYVVVATNEYGCQMETATTLIFNDIPDMQMSGDFKICPGESIVIGVSGANEYEWNGGSNGDECTFSEPGNGYVIGRDGYGCQKRIDFTIEELPVPRVIVSATPAKIRRGDSDVSLALESDDDLSECTYIWMTSDGETSSQQSFTHTFNADEAMVFSAIAVVETKDGCKLRLHATVETEFEIPNTFTPNGDMINDHFMKGYHVEIKDRHGIMLYQGNDGWNGVLPNGKITHDTYFYIVTDKIGQKHYGYVTVAG